MVDVPDLVITEDGEYDLVSLPGGTENVISGDPQVPSYTTIITVPVGWLVANVTMVSRSQPKIYEDLNIPPAAVYIDGESLANQAPVYGEGWYPGTDFEWEVIDEAGGQELIIKAYPAAYNGLIAQLKFFDRYEFEIDYLESPLTIVDAYMDSYTLNPGDDISVEIEIESISEEEVRAILEGTIRPCVENAPVDGVELHLIDVLGRTSVAVGWSVGQLEKGGYALDIILRDDRGNPLCSRTVRFWIGSIPLNITSISVDPESTAPGGSVDVSISIGNSGGDPADGQLWLWVYDSEGRRVLESVGNLDLISPNTVLSFSESISVVGLGTGAYDVRGYVILNGQMLESRTASFSIGEEILLLILVQAFATFALRRAPQ